MTRVQESLLYKIARGVLGLHGPCNSSSLHTGRGHGPCWIEGISTGREGLGLHGSGNAARAMCGTAPLHGSSARSVLVARVVQRAVLLGLDTAWDCWAGLELEMGHDAGFGL